MPIGYSLSPQPDLAAAEAAILRLIRIERFLRDQGDWDGLAECYTGDSTVITTWFTGTGREFARASREMAENGRHSKHLIWPAVVRVAGDRALAESPAAIVNRSTIDGIEVDMIQWCRFHSRVVRDGDGWLLASFEGIYQKDEIRPVWPGDQLPAQWWAEIRPLRPSYRIWAWAMLRRGYQVSSELLGDDRPDLMQRFYAGQDTWLAGGE